MARGKTKKVELTFEERQQESVKRDLDRLLEEYETIPEPTYKFNIGDSVIIGNLKDVTVEKIIDDGKLYVVDYTGIDHNYVSPKRTEHCKGVWMWTALRKPNDNKNSFVKNNDIRISYSQRTISALFTHAYHFGFDLDPIYQRGLVWHLEDKVALIDSIFNNVDIGKFTFIKPDNIMEKNEVLDGKQRLTTLLEFYEDRFEYKGYKFSDLSIRDQCHIEDYSISWGESEHLTEEQKLRYFIKLNTTGKPMDEKHIEKVKHMLEEIK
jgi:hypothetical protein